MGASANKRPSTTFCWLPPESCPIRVPSDGVRTRNRSTVRAASRRSLARLITPARDSRESHAADRFCCTERVGSSALRLRSSGTKPIPARIAARGVLASQRPIVHEHLAARADAAAEREAELALARADEAGDPQDLARAEVEARVPRPIRPRS